MTTIGDAPGRGLSDFYYVFLGDFIKDLNFSIGCGASPPMARSPTGLPIGQCIVATRRAVEAVDGAGARKSSRGRSL
jgi:hypothetical protein